MALDPLSERLRRRLDTVGGEAPPVGDRATKLGSRLDVVLPPVLRLSVDRRLEAKDQLVLLDAGGLTLTLPDGDDHLTGVLTVKDASGVAAGQPHTLTPHGTQTIDGAGTRQMAADWQSLTLRFIDGHWYIL